MKIRTTLCVLLLSSIVACGTQVSGLKAEPSKAERVDDPLLTSLYIAGTHDACAYVTGGPLILTQSSTIDEQLEQGIRALDIRLRARGDGSHTLIAYHGPACQGQTFTQILDQCIRFLQNHPETFVLMTLKEEGAPLQKDGETYAEALRSTLDDPKYAVHVATGIDSTTTLSKVRGKLLLLHRSSIGATDQLQVGPWKDNATFQTAVAYGDQKVLDLFVQDNYKANAGAKNKQTAIEAAFDTAPLKAQLNLFYISATGPLCYPDRAAMILNPFTLDVLRGKPTPPPGVYFMDFVARNEGRALTQYLIDLNKTK